MNEIRGDKKSWTMRAVPGALALVLGFAGTGVAVETSGSALDGAQLAAVLGVPIGPRLGIVPKHEVGRGDTDAPVADIVDDQSSTDPAEAVEAVAAPRVAEPADAEEVVAAAAPAGSSRIDALRDRFSGADVAGRTAAASPEVVSDATPESVVAEATPELVVAEAPSAADDRENVKPEHARRRRVTLASLFGRDRSEPEAAPQVLAAAAHAAAGQQAPAAAPEALAIPVEVAPQPALEPKPVAVPEVEPAPAPAPVQVVSAPVAAPVQLAMNTTTAAAAKTVTRAAAKPAPAPVHLAQAAVHDELPMPRSPSASHAPLEGAAVHANPSSANIAARGDARRSRPNIMRVLAGKSLIIDLKSDAKRVSVANPEVAEVLVVTPRQVMINGLAEGETSIIIWDRAGNYTMNSLVVGNTLQDQVMLEVTVAEINRTAMEQHGVDIRALNGNWAGFSQFGNVAPISGQYPPGQAEPLLPIGLDGGISWGIINLKEDIAILFKQLQDENLARVLAEPKLLARSGQEANFLSGGEIPIVITQNQDTTIEFKEFGTKVVFVPRVREDGMIDLEVASEVSEPDFAAGVELFGFNVPAFITRRVDTDVSLADGESLIIAGLIKETKQEIESKMPFIGDIPFLGYFFRATEYKNEIKELVMVVRPRLVDPIQRGSRVSLPTDRGPLTRDEVKTQPTDAKVSRPRPW